MDIGTLPNFSDYIVFVDESGSPTLDPVDPDYPIFVLIFCVVHKLDYAKSIQPAFKQLKFRYFGHDMISLHSHAIRKPKGEFAFLHSREIREAFLDDLNKIMVTEAYHLIVHIIDKIVLKERYSKPYDPYNIALRMNMEQLTIFLREKGQANKLCHIIAESRGKKEDNQLELEFRRVIDPANGWGMANKFSFADVDLNLRFVEKKINSAGLQIADLAGQPIGRNHLKPEQENRSYDIVKQKIYKTIWTFP